jgi:hypothetical protein
LRRYPHASVVPTTQRNQQQLHETQQRDETVVSQSLQEVADLTYSTIDSPVHSIRDAADSTLDYASHSLQNVADSTYSTVSDMVSSMYYHETQSNDTNHNDLRLPVILIHRKMDKDNNLLVSVSSRRFSSSRRNSLFSPSSVPPAWMWKNPYNFVRGRHVKQLNRSSSMSAVRDLIALVEYHIDNNNKKTTFLTTRTQTMTGPVPMKKTTTTRL